MSTLRPYKFKLSTTVENYLGKIYAALERAHDAAPYLKHVFIQTVFCFYAVEINLFNRAQARHHLANLPRNIVDELNRALKNNAKGFNWKALSPTVLSALLESIVNPDAKNFEGVRYVAEKNIHKVIDVLFFDEFRAEFEQSVGDSHKLIDLQFKIAALRFFDPAFGAGVFSVETFLSLRRLENRILKELNSTDIKVAPLQFYGIELNDFAIETANTAMWIADCLTVRELSTMLDQPLRFPAFKPLKHVTCGNALTVEWEEFLPDGIDYIFGSPPSLGMTQRSKEQKYEIADIFRDEIGNQYAKNGKLDYAAAWFFKAAQYMFGRKTRTAFVATDSLCQSELAQLVWQPLFDRFGVHIDFAYQSFKWVEDCLRLQRLYSVAVGFSCALSDRPRYIFNGDRRVEATNINGYLLDAPNFFIKGLLKPLCEVPAIHQGNQATDGGNLIIEADEYDEFIRREPAAKKYIRRFMMGREFVNNLPRWCLWLVDLKEEELEQMPLVAARIEAVRRFREASTFIKTRRLAQKPHLFREQITPERFIAIPKVLSEKRPYLTAGWLDSSVIAGDQLFMIEGAGLYEFGVLESSVHMAWTRALGGRFGSGFCYSKTIIYNNFVWCNPTRAQRLTIERTAKGIIKARKLYPDCSLAELYDAKKMPSELRAAHEENDWVVLDAYGFGGLTELEIVSRLMTDCLKMLEKRDELEMLA